MSSQPSEACAASDLVAQRQLQPTPHPRFVEYSLEVILDSVFVGANDSGDLIVLQTLSDQDSDSFFSSSKSFVHMILTSQNTDR
jgi:hypothetical protein